MCNSIEKNICAPVFVYFYKSISPHENHRDDLSWHICAGLRRFRSAAALCQFVGGGSYFLNSTLPSKRIASTPRATEKLTKTPHIYSDLEPPPLLSSISGAYGTITLSKTKTTKSPRGVYACILQRVLVSRFANQ